MIRYISLLALVFLTSFTFQNPFVYEPPRANQERILAHITALSQYGKSEGGTNRMAYTQADVEARAYMAEQMKKAGLEVHIDFAGNIIGRRKGKNNNLKPIVFGSHIDSVPKGGNYDGVVGSVGALEVMTILHENDMLTDHPLEMIIFQNEEGGLVGSRALTGLLKPENLSLMTLSKKTIGEGIKFIGGDPDRIPEVQRKIGDIKAFIELHIEQGAILDTKKLNIGVVEGIVGIEWWGITINGFANHAGTTPMNMRKDAVLAGSKLALAVNEIVNSFEGGQVGTVGRFQASPGAPNVIPGQVIMSLEIRDLDREKIWNIFKKIEERAALIANETGTEISFDYLNIASIPAQCDLRIQNAIVKSSKELGLTYQKMPSGAGHDAQDMAKLAPTGMIFIPSKGGISHSPNEYSTPEDMANGVNVLLRTILTLDKDTRF